MSKDPNLETIFGTIFQEYWDDEVCRAGGNGEVVIDARTIRVFMRVFGEKFVSDSLQRWEVEGIVKRLGDPNAIDPESPCIQVMNYH